MTSARERIDRVVIRLATWAPIRLTGEYGPERLLLNFAFILIGLGAIFDTPPGLLDLWTHWFAIEWGVAMVLGGVFVLYGIVAGSRARSPAAQATARSVEWIGYILVGGAALVFGVSTLLHFGLSSLRSIVLFLAIAFAKGDRLLLGYAARVVERAQRREASS